MKATAPRLVAIKPLPIEENKDILQRTEENQEQMIKKQNRGTVILLGRKCDDWIQPGDTVSFYRNAATEITDDDGEKFVTVHEDHILAKF